MTSNSSYAIFQYPHFFTQVLKSMVSSELMELSFHSAIVYLHAFHLHLRWPFHLYRSLDTYALSNVLACWRGPWDVS